MATRSTEANLAAEVRGSTGLRLLTFSQEHAPGRSVGLITAETSQAFPPAGGRVWEDPPPAVVFKAAGARNPARPETREREGADQEWRRMPGPAKRGFFCTPNGRRIVGV